MADYDVGALALTLPPAKAVITSYRPAVSVRNNGIHDALASGTLRIYKAGLLIFTTEIYSPTIVPGETKAATATDYWTPPSVGTYQVIAYVSCPLDQYEPNNSLAPTLVTVTAEPPPPAPTVALHASQHEEGGTDELSIDGLAGRAKDPQVPFDHVANHETGGSDVLDVTGLHGQLADGQPTTVHGNEKHSPPFATPASVAEVVNAHNAATPAHAASTNLEHTANKGAPSGYASLDEYTRVPVDQLGTIVIPPIGRTEVLHMDSNWRNPAPAEPTAHHVSHEAAGADELSVAGLHGQLGDLQPVATHKASHETGGPDELSVAGLHGQLGDLQPVKAHHDSHATGGSDEITVAGLQGVLAEPQVPSNHTAVAHDTSVEATAHKGAASGYCELDAGALVPVARIPAVAVPAHAVSHQDGGSDEISIAGLSGKAADAQTPVNHGATHGHEGGDDISIGGLSGMPAAAGVALGLATLDIAGQLTGSQTPAGVQLTSEKGAANGYAPLDAGAKVPVANLPGMPPSLHDNTVHTTGAPITLRPSHFNSQGISAAVARADHSHSVAGTVYASGANVELQNGTWTTLALLTVPSNALIQNNAWTARFHGFWQPNLGLTPAEIRGRIILRQNLVDYEIGLLSATLSWNQNPAGQMGFRFETFVALLVIGDFTMARAISTILSDGSQLAENRTVLTASAPAIGLNPALPIEILLQASGTIPEAQFLTLTYSDLGIHSVAAI